MDIKTEIKKLEDGTIDINVVLPWSVVKKTKDEVIDEHVKDATLPGFRKGKAPKDIVEKSLDGGHIKEDVLRKLLPEAYAKAINDLKIKPIISPKIHVQKIDENQDWEFSAQTCEMPTIDLGNYKAEVKKITGKSKIVVPGKESAPVSFEEITKALLDSSKITIPAVIIDQEVEKLLAQTLDEIKRLGLTLDQYLASTGKNIDALRDGYKVKAETDVKLEFILQEIARSENITVEDKEIEDALNTAKTPAERQNLEQNKYLLASIIRQQKTLDFLKNL
ncbi:MAG: trigger factor [Patescibacteria group bacterium]